MVLTYLVVLANIYMYLSQGKYLYILDMSLLVLFDKIVKYFENKNGKLLQFVNMRALP